MDTEKSLKKRPNGAPVGNSNSLRHGLYALKGKALQLRTRRVKALARRVRGALPWLQDSDMPTVRSWCEIEYIGAAVFTLLEAGGVTSGRDKAGDIVPRRLLAEYRQLKQVQLAYAKELGMTPAARAALRVDALHGDDLAARASRLRDAVD